MPTMPCNMTLDDGRKVRIRPIGPDDIEAERAFIMALSPGLRRYRFLEQIGEPSDAMLRTLTHVDHKDHVALVAVAEDGEHAGQFVGVTRFARSHEPESGEMALVVLDDWRESGLKRELLQQLTSIAARQGLRRLFTLESADNRYMRDFASQHGFRSRPDPEDSTQVFYTLELD
ncbi:N-acetyltransferase family protein [Luteimonas sp. e5]